MKLYNFQWTLRAHQLQAHCWRKSYRAYTAISTRLLAPVTFHNFRSPVSTVTYRLVSSTPTSRKNVSPPLDDPLEESELEMLLTFDSENKIIVPPKPKPPSGDDCCGSGCAYCVWDAYEEKIQIYQLAKRKRAEQNLELAQREEVAEAGILEEATADEMDPGMKAFLEMERAMKNKK